METVLVIGGMLALLLIFQRWFWFLVFLIGGIASLFACIASIIHFQILAALGYLFLFLLLEAFAGVVADA